MNNSQQHAYCAGLFDGEGNIHIWRCSKNSKRFRIEITIANTNIECLEFVQNVFNFGYVQIARRCKSDLVKSNNHWKILYRYRLGELKNCMIFLEKIIPYLIIKRTQALNALEWCKLKICDPFAIPTTIIVLKKK